MAIINGNNGNNTIRGTNQADTIHGRGGNDTINALAGNDDVFGDAGNDSIGGGSGNDDMDGGTGNDFVQGGAGNDVLFGGATGGRDRLAGDAPRGGGTGADEFQYSASQSGTDRIFDFGNPQAPDGVPEAGDHVLLLDATTQEIFDVYGPNINTDDQGVANVGGDLVIDFGAETLGGTGILTIDNGFTTLGPNGLLVGTDIIGNDPVV